MKKILLIEDDRDLAELYTEVLEGNFEVIVAHDGREGLSLAKKNPRPDLVLLDILLPEMNGFDLLKELKNDKDIREVPVIVLTNLGSKHVDEDRKMAMLLGAEDYLVKAYHQPDQIVKKVSEHINK